MKYRSKSYWRIPFGEVQYGHVTRSLGVWLFGRHYWIRRPR